VTAVKVLVLGGSGMLGHKVWQVFSARFDTYVTLRRPPGEQAAALFDHGRTLTGITAEDDEALVRALAEVEPDVVLNCIGIVKQAAAAKDPVTSITVNALFPHRLARLCANAGARMIQISTDCVFSGRTGHYSEDDPADPQDLYGRTKLLGETSYDHTVTLRTSIIGRELSGANGLLEWFLSQNGRTPVRGYTRAVFSGLTTEALAVTLARIAADHEGLSGIWHVAADPISKFDLLVELGRVFGRETSIVPDETVVIDRSLDGDRFRNATGIEPPSWPQMLARLAADETPYAAIRS
jgi:dTDP-4-dehydrorhamnose reductase